jgi:hypothetical protein
MPKAHLTAREEPLRSGETVTAICSAEIPDAQIVYVWDSAEVLEKVNVGVLRAICSKCRKSYVAIEGRSLLYAVN